MSIVAAPCRALTAAARWNGQAPHTATGEANTREAHCQLRNCSGGTIASTTTGMASASETSSRHRSASASPAPSSSPGLACEAGRTAEYPACSTTEIRSPVLTVAGKLTRAVSVAKLTVAVTPSSLLSFFSTRAAHEAHVIPPIASSARPAEPPGIPAGISPMTALTRITPFPCAGACTWLVRQERSSGRTVSVPAPADLSRNRAWPPGRVLSCRRAGSRRPCPAPRPPPARSAVPRW